MSKNIARSYINTCNNYLAHSYIWDTIYNIAA